MNRTGKYVLITGTSTGIGRACVTRLDRLGFNVFATVRRQEDADDLRKIVSDRVIPLIMDITETESIISAYKKVAEITGDFGLYGLVGNPSIAIAGPLEFMPMDEIKKHFEVNVFGHIALTQQFLPLIRRAKGRIIYIGSINGIVSAPFVSAYCASKFAMEAITNSLRMELQPWGIPVSIVDPNNISTPMWEKSIVKSNEIFSKLPEKAHEFYKKTIDSVLKTADNTGKTAVQPDIIAKAVEHALLSDNPKNRYLPGMDTKLTYILDKILPTAVINKLIKSEMGISN